VIIGISALDCPKNLRLWSLRLGDDSMVGFILLGFVFLVGFWLGGLFGPFDADDELARLDDELRKIDFELGEGVSDG
jgi:hypothetical protein